MKLKYYVLFAFIFMFFWGLYLYSLNDSEYTYAVPFSETSITLPVALLSLIHI